MVKITRRSLAAVGAALVVAPQAALVVAPDAFAEQSTAVSFWSGPASRDARLQEAKSLLNDFSRLEAAIPTLSPREDEWVTREYRDALAASGGKVSERYFRLTDSKEYNIKHALLWVNNVTGLLRDITKSDNDTIREVRLWSGLVMLLANGQNIEQTWRLTELEVISRDNLPTAATQNREIYVANIVLIAHFAQMNVVVPFLTQTLP